MKLTSDLPFWLLRNGLTTSYPSMEQDHVCDVAVLGAGITGAMIADEIARSGYSVAVVDRRDVCTGSTSASTALLQYEIDVCLTEMRTQIGIDQANRAYRASHNSIDRLEALAETLDNRCNFQRKTSIYLADDRRSALDLAHEARARRSIGLDVEYLDADALNSTFGIEGMAALSSHQAASCDPFRLAHTLLARAVCHGATIFDRTEIASFDCLKDRVTLTARNGRQLSARWMIVATGYESTQMIRGRFVNLDNTYALVSEPMETVEPWNEDWLLWEAKTPYLYLRITSDKRLLAGGEDDEFHSPVRRDAAIEKRSQVVETKVRKLIPDLRWQTAYKWAGTFGKTKDGLPYIGPHDQWPSTYFALCFGGNGITFSALAAPMMLEFLQTGKAENADLFRFGR